MTVDERFALSATTPGPQELPDFETMCRMWALSDHWPLHDALRLSMGIPPRIFGVEPDEDKARKLAMRYEIACNCVGDTLKVINPDAPNDQLRTRPGDFLMWLERKGLRLPEELQCAVAEQGQLASQHSPSRFRPSQRHQERAQAIAALIWDQEPELTIKAMAERPEILKYACEGSQYSVNTIRGWIKELCPNRAPGRRAQT